MTERLHKFLSQAGVASRRAAEVMISQGRVTVNGRIAHVGQSIDPQNDIVCVDGHAVQLEKHVYLMLNKPAGYITTAKDTHGRKTVLDLLPEGERVFPVGRLDKDTEGLLLFTNDGELSHKLLHPSRHVDKTYLVEVEGRLTAANITALESGIELFDGITSPAKVAKVEIKPKTTVFYLTIHEGRKRQIRRMCGILGREVVYLKRVSLGPLSLGNLECGKHRSLSAEEIALLRQYIER